MPAQAHASEDGDGADSTPAAKPKGSGSLATESSSAGAAGKSRSEAWLRHVLCCCCTDIFGGLAGYVICLYGLTALAHHYPSAGLPLLAVVPPLLLVAMCSLRHLDGLNGCQLVLTVSCAALWMSPLLLLQWALATSHIPTMIYAFDSRCALCIELQGGYESKNVDVCRCWGKTFVQAFVLSALPEELLKLVAVLGVANRTHISRPAALVMYAMGASAGFAAVENILYVCGEMGEIAEDGNNGSSFVAPDGATTTAVARAAMAIPLHLTCGALIGVGLARWRWLSKRGTLSRQLWTLVNRAEQDSSGTMDQTRGATGTCNVCTCACYGGLPCCSALAIVVPAMVVHTVYDGVLMAPYNTYDSIEGSLSHKQILYVGSGLATLVGLVGVYVLSLPLMAPGIAEQDDTLEPDEDHRVAQWPARRRAGVNLADCVYASILCCVHDDYYDDEDARLATERARARRTVEIPKPGPAAQDALASRP